MTDWYTTLFPRGPGQRQPGETRRGSAPGPETGAVIGAAVGRSPRPGRMSDPNYNPMVADGPATLTEGDIAPNRAIGEVQEATARIGRRMRYTPRLPVMEGEETAPVFPFGAEASTAPPTRRASQAVGVPQRYLDTLIVQESGGDADIKATTSSATGHAQFIDSTWRNMMGRFGDRYGLDETTRAAIADEDLLHLRTDPQWAALMAAEHARENAEALRSSLGRDPTLGEVYLAHFAGIGPSADMIRAADEDRRRERGRARRGIDFVSEAAADANRSVFYEGNRPRTVAEVIERQMGKFGRSRFIMRDRGSTE